MFSRTIGMSPKAYRRENAGRAFEPPSIEQLRGVERKPGCSDIYNPLRPHFIDPSRVQLMARCRTWWLSSLKKASLSGRRHV